MRPDGPPDPYRPMTVADGLLSHAAAAPKRPALRWEGGALTYGALAERVSRVAQASAGAVGPGARAAIVAPNVPEYFEVVLGVSLAGGAVATLNPRQTPSELRAVLEDSAPRLIVADAGSEALVREAAEGSGAAIRIVGRDYGAWRDAARPIRPAVPVDERETFAIPYTSGTTGAPKGVMLSHRSRVVSALIYASVYGCFARDDRFLVTTPLHHGGGFAFPLATLTTGGEVVLSSGPKALRAELVHVTGSFVVPTQLARLGTAPVGAPGLRAVICNAAPLPEAVKLGALEALGEDVLHETYGSTEAGVVANLFPEEMRLKRACVGRPILGQMVRLLDGDREAAPGAVGELFSNGPTLFNGYLNRPEETTEGFRDGMFSAGDLARRDEEGFLHIVGRRKDVIITGGVNVIPRDVEEALADHPAVADVAVAGLPDPEWGEAVCAFVVRAGPVDEAELLALARTALAPHKRPKQVRFVDEIPRSPAGKVLKRALREGAMSGPA